ncbi:MAG: hypothetical protein UW07_C0017G0016 [Candidatus Nomurabacteria bacterium GW2011_GWF2_43_8]|uniref:DUF4258 domain-containing protein n=2 Tax=Candidatus Nomuraibacteriota TaxID=1752729 RepID=A0A0G1FPS3_9BACT|nr:MAG: hypothetical protein UV76_C0003G0045 [Candidatus Nomurabacteria bacterium GW2011_GWA2_43_15]KKT24360.1 MAG: hypothetical protein UW07_C0017G0016 [Candidatus Nomurabacteria bacterium GW2011_GWF2_43_8]
MKIIFTDHSKERISERGIVISDIKKAINSPTSHLWSYPPTQKIQKIVKGKTLEIVFEQKGQIIIIITAYYL